MTAMAEPRKIAYFPGCTLKTIDRSYDYSTRVVAGHLGIELDPLKNCNCSGAGEMKSLGDVGLMFPVRNLMLAREMGYREVVMPCSVCYHELSRANKIMKEDKERLDGVNKILSEAGEPIYQPDVTERHFLEYLYNKVGIDEIKSKVKMPLKGLKVGAYYGCLYSRPSVFTGTGRTDRLDDPERPYYMHRILEAIGCTMVTYGNETACCGGRNMMQDEETSFKLIYDTLSKAKKAGADIVSLICPKCAGGLDILQPKITKHLGSEANIPVVFVTQLIGLAFGESGKKMLLKDMESDAYPALKEKGFA
jgi:heterodisulfide reductase subunit B2